MTIDTFSHIPYSILKGSISRIIQNRTMLFNLLRIRESHQYGISQIFNEACIARPIGLWETVEILVKGQPKLASILVPFDCIESLQKNIDHSGSTSDLLFQDLYHFTKKLSPLPVTLDSEDSITLFLENFLLVDEMESGYWLSVNPLAKIIDKVYNNQQILNSGITSHFLLTDILDEPDTKKKYFSMLQSINNPIELFGHAINLNYLLIEIEKGILKKYPIVEDIGDSLKKVLENIGKRLFPLRKSEMDMRSEEGFFYHIDLISPKEMKKNRSAINHQLQTYNRLNFNQLVDFIVLKLGGDCRQFLSEENQARLINGPSITTIVYELCLDKKARIDWFHKRLRKLPNHYDVSHIVGNLDDRMELLWEEFYALPSKVNEISLFDFLDGLQRDLSNDAQEQLVITKNHNRIRINVKSYNDNIPQMQPNTFNYLTVSLAKQIYCGSEEEFEKDLLGWINALVEQKEDFDGMEIDLKAMVEDIYSSIDSITVVPRIQVF